MNAQEKWKHFFREYHFSRLYLSYQVQANLREIMSEYRREAALERHLTAQQRTIEAQAAMIAELEARIDNTVEHLDIDRGAEWEAEYYLRGMHRQESAG